MNSFHGKLFYFIVIEISIDTAEPILLSNLGYIIIIIVSFLVYCMKSVATKLAPVDRSGCFSLQLDLAYTKSMLTVSARSKCDCLLQIFVIINYL